MVHKEATESFSAVAPPYMESSSAATDSDATNSDSEMGSDCMEESMLVVSVGELEADMGKGMYGAVRRFKDRYIKALSPTWPCRHIAPRPYLGQKFHMYKTSRLHPDVRLVLFIVYIIVMSLVISVALYFHSYAARTDLGIPYRVDCSDVPSTLFGRTNRMLGNRRGHDFWRTRSDQGEIPTSWMSIRCPGFCQYRGALDGARAEQAVMGIGPPSQALEAPLGQISGTSTTQSNFHQQIVNSSDNVSPRPVQLSSASRVAMDPPEQIYNISESSTTSLHHTYTADSAMCMAAIDSGLISGLGGSCLSLKILPDPRVKHDPGSGGTVGWGNGPYRFSNYVVEYAPCREQRHCHDLGPLVLTLCLASLLACLLLSPTRGGFFSCTMLLGYWYMVLVGSPTYTAGGTNRLDDALGTFPLFVLCVYGLHKFLKQGGVPCTPRSGEYVAENFALFVVPFFVMLHMNYAKPFLNFVLSPHGLEDMTSAQLAVIILIGTVVLVCIALQLRMVYLHGLLPTYVLWYSLLLGLTTLITTVTTVTTGLHFHLHHYELALLLMPLVAFPARHCLLGQAVLCGVFVNGVACYGFDSTWVTV